ncbi:hypothetical protein SASPL_156589 [Salvia splendens]|uniref:Cis-zeatin O-glucosyltransferase n=1 Tax=Salvia splendens TaxID=180675 RepID=A0A8X8VWJ3_SALSN|nr:hypothetical protein SASPL_156589 [Salvia splendens]
MECLWTQMERGVEKDTSSGSRRGGTKTLGRDRGHKKTTIGFLDSNRLADVKNDRDAGMRKTRTVRCSCWRSRNARLASAIAGVEFVRGKHDGGVAIAAWPMHSDQLSNAALVADVLKTEIVVREWKDRAGVVKASLIESVVRRFMASEKGCRIKETAEKLGAAVREATEAGGVSRIELDSFIAHVIR